MIDPSKKHSEDELIGAADSADNIADHLKEADRLTEEMEALDEGIEVSPEIADLIGGQQVDELPED